MKHKTAWYIEYSYDPNPSMNHTVETIFADKNEALQCARRAAESGVDDMGDIDDSEYRSVEDSGDVVDGFQVYITEDGNRIDTWTIKQGTFHE